jgi:hypothetical protein
MQPVTENALVILTIGHSTRTLAEFLLLLRAHQVKRVIDVRTIPRSRHNPQFDLSFPAALRKAGVGYRHMPGLGGLRHARTDSPNGAWRNASFRGFADYMQTGEFERSLQELLMAARRDRVALMCAEAVPWRCHRSLIADALVARGIRVEHIMSAMQRRAHTLSGWAVVRGGQVFYPADADAARLARPRQSSSRRKGLEVMAKEFKAGDRVSWNSEAGRVRGTIKKKFTSATRFKGYTARASREEPQYLISSDKTGHLAMHKGTVLRRLAKRPGRSAP